MTQTKKEENETEEGEEEEGAKGEKRGRGRRMEWAVGGLVHGEREQNSFGGE